MIKNRLVEMIEADGLTSGTEIAKHTAGQYAAGTLEPEQSAKEFLAG